MEETTTQPTQMSFKYWFDYYCNLATWFNDNFDTLTNKEIEKFRMELLTIANKLIHHMSENNIVDTSDDAIVRAKNYIKIDVDEPVKM